MTFDSIVHVITLRTMKCNEAKSSQTLDCAVWFIYRCGCSETATFTDHTLPENPLLRDDFPASRMLVSLDQSPCPLVSIRTTLLETDDCHDCWRSRKAAEAGGHRHEGEIFRPDGSVHNSRESPVESPSPGEDARIHEAATVPNGGSRRKRIPLGEVCKNLISKSTADTDSSLQ
ncbi:uncharacterized protein B0I36DRAFT_344949 [Microdochium trichocladiopsis]|uniref:Uncharacterized protein n=1 Tax=Microdochium trichocladiopsis TaxID=1682393 RepID=A0A9P9BUU1_9PEZI|nr:uncharacterized protein B0I36DRAFT_344949 [Microdochium trichocladiopsis]KAH7041336.1 hypothetical protein B0I36DRAFT_344949 [Microdochium trichocladiopsis]